jgi:A/G-specific adenine glycosylase
VRIYRRIFGFDWESDQESHAWEFAEEILPADHAQKYNLALLDFGATVCTASNPACPVCPLSDMCEYFQSGKLTKTD